MGARIEITNSRPVYRLRNSLALPLVMMSPSEKKRKSCIAQRLLLAAHFFLGARCARNQVEEKLLHNSRLLLRIRIRNDSGKAEKILDSQSEGDFLLVTGGGDPLVELFPTDWNKGLVRLCVCVFVCSRKCVNERFVDRIFFSCYTLAVGALAGWTGVEFGKKKSSHVQT